LTGPIGGGAGRDFRELRVYKTGASGGGAWAGAHKVGWAKFSAE